MQIYFFKLVFRFLLVCICSFFAYGILPVYAATHINSQTVFHSGTSWTKENSPYIIDESITIPSGTSLYVFPGVSIVASSTSDNPISIYASGDIAFAGTALEPIVVAGLDSISYSHDNSIIDNTHFSISSGLTFSYSTSSISFSSISDSYTAVDARGSTIVIATSTIENNGYGVYSRLALSGPFLSIFGRTAIADTVNDPKQNQISISNSRIVDNSLYGIYNVTSNTIAAQNNWWGNSSGPRIIGSATSTDLVGGDKVSGLANVDPWLTEDLNMTKSAVVCCSNVLFLPGIEASRLYLDSKGVFGNLVGTATNKLWEPNSSADIAKLKMDDTGKGITAGVYTKDIIDSIFGFGVYKNFIVMMNSMVASGTINSWEPFPYDWRYSVANIVDGNAKGSDSRLLADFMSLASNSKTGKVTIVAHSNGGLIAKRLGRVIATLGKADLIDKVIMVAVPENGTPEAIAGLLHGDDQVILGGLIMSQSSARELGDNSPGMYGLLPSRSYFNALGNFPNVFTPIITVASSAISSFHFTNSEQSVSTFDVLQHFLTGIFDGRSLPSYGNISVPALLHSTMLAGADTLHSEIDNFVFSTSTEVVSLIGVGNQTLSSLHYDKKASCPLTNALPGIYRTTPCTDSLVHTASTTTFGDGTVVALSAEQASGVSQGTSNYYFNLASYNKDQAPAIDHSNILNSIPSIGFVKSKIESTTTDNVSLIASSGSYITSSVPNLQTLGVDNLVLTMHSPVDMNVYDMYGRHTGPVSNGDPNSDLLRYEENIPGSIYRPSASEGTSISLPYSDTYKVILNGTGEGLFTLTTERDKDGITLSQTSFSDLPATPLLKAELLLATTTKKTDATATTSQMLLLDFEGDGIIDATTTPSQPIDQTLYLRSMERRIRGFHLSPYREKIMCDKIEKILSYMKLKKKIDMDDKLSIEAESAIHDLDNKHWIYKNLNQNQIDKMTNVFESILNSVLI